MASMADRRRDGAYSPSGALADLDRVAEGKRSGLALTHDNPDPDAMASAAGMAFLLERRHGIPTRLGYGGIIGRAENRELVRQLKLPMTPMSRVEVADHDLVVLVDTQAPTGNHSLPPGRLPEVVVDHHPERPGSRQSPLCFVSEDYGATSSMVTALIREAGLSPPASIATALFYGVKSDTRGLGRESEPADTEAYNWLFPRSDHELLARIEHPQVPLSYFKAYHTAYERARVYGNVITVDLGHVYTPDIVPEIAERLSFLEGVKWSCAMGSFEGELYVSVRTNDKRMNAGKQIQGLTSDLGGSAGGHGQMAGARVPLEGRSRDATDRLRRELLDRFQRTFGGLEESGRPIV